MCWFDRRTLAIGLVGLVASLLGLAPGALAQSSGEPDDSSDGGYGDRGRIVEDEVTGVVKITATTESLPLAAENSSDPNCAVSSVTVYVADDFATPVTSSFFLADAFDGTTLQSFWFTAAQGRPVATRLFSPTGRWFGAFCDGSLAFVPEGGPSVSIPGLVQRVVDQLDPPKPDLAVTPEHGKHVVNMRSWMAVEPAYWTAPRRATAVAGRVTVTAWLEPFEVVWDMGNGEVEDCGGPGTVWSRGMDDALASCHYTYDQPSINPPSHTYDLEGTVRFDVNHTTNAPGVYGPFTPVERSTSETIQVVEIQAVGS